MSFNFSSPVPGRKSPKGREPNLAGDKYGRLTLVAEVPGQMVSQSLRKWHVQCECGNTALSVRMTHMRSGNTASCGCIQKEVAATTKTTHGMHGSPIHRVWGGMVQRCTNPKNKRFADYGGRGISVCKAWETFDGFYADMGASYLEGLSIDRIDNNKGYSPENCRWATRNEQVRNQRRSRLVNYQGRNICLAEACEMSGLKYNTVEGRLNRYGWPIHCALGPQFGEPA